VTIAKILRGVGIAGTILCIAVFIREPSWPTPDKLLVFLTFIFMIFGRALTMLKHMLPFVGLLLLYETFRGIVPSLNSHVHYRLMIDVDRFLFHGLPTAHLQHLLWHGHIQWYDFVFYLAYMLHFVLPISLALLIWKYHDSHYWQFVATYATVSFAGFLTFLLYPAAPPWLAVQNGYIEPVRRISSDVWWGLGIHDFPTVYNKISPNPVAAVPSLHAEYATLLIIFVYKYFGKKWAAIACIYPFLIYVGTVYMGEHYAFDELLGIVYAVAGYAAVAFAFKRGAPYYRRTFRPALRRTLPYLKKLQLREDY
jgi:hypothetical protein